MSCISNFEHVAVPLLPGLSKSQWEIRLWKSNLMGAVKRSEMLLLPARDEKKFMSCQIETPHKKGTLYTWDRSSSMDLVGFNCQWIEVPLANRSPSQASPTYFPENKATSIDFLQSTLVWIRQNFNFEAESFFCGFSDCSAVSASWVPQEKHNKNNNSNERMHRRFLLINWS